jgi:hypothetical protein
MKGSFMSIFVTNTTCFSSGGVLLSHVFTTTVFSGYRYVIFFGAIDLGTLWIKPVDRLLHHTETVVIEGRSYRMKETIED